MNYQKIHDSIIDKYRFVETRKQGNLLFGYVERHHVIPESVGGPDTDENQVYLPARAHFFVHLLLIKIFTGWKRDCMESAIEWMSIGGQKDRYKISPRTYAKIRSQIASKPVSEETRLKMSESSKGILHTEETKRKLSIMLTGQRRTESTKRNISLSKIGKSTGPRSEETKLKISNSIKALIQSRGEGFSAGKKRTPKMKEFSDVR